MAKQNLVSPKVKAEINKEFTKESFKQEMSQKITDLIFKYKVYPETYLDDLLQLSIERPDVINQILKQVRSKK